MKPDSILYLDHAATTFVDLEVVNLMCELYARPLGNPSSQHRFGRSAQSILEQAKNQLLVSVGATSSTMDAATVIATSGGTEANNLAILGLAQARPGKIVVSAIEHPSVIETAEKLASAGREFRVLPVDHHGLCRMDILHDWLNEHHGSSLRADSSGISILSVMLGNNEVGVIQDLRTICQLCHEFGCMVHADCVQAVGKIPFSMQETGLDALTVTAHKLHGPVGVGALIVRAGLTPKPLFFGGGQQLGVRPGTESAVMLAAFAKAVDLSWRALESGQYDSVGRLRDEFERQILETIDGSIIVGGTSPRLPHISNLAFDGLDRQALLMALDLAGIQCSSGSACASGSSRPSPVLKAMEVPLSYAMGSMRFSLSRFTTADELKWAVEKIGEIVMKMRKRTGSGR